MEKQQAPSSDATRPSQQQKQRSQTRFWIITVLFLGLIGWQIRSGKGTWFPLGSSHSSAETNDERHPKKHFLTWNEITTKRYLDYSPCYEDDFQCARLELPMDYFNVTTNSTISLAVIRKPAAVPVTHPQYGGAVLLNPGGPGGSGVFFLRYAGSALSETLDDPENGKYFDLISFDPRGVVNSKPSIACFDDPLLEQSWLMRLAEEGLISSSDAAFGRIWSMTVASSGSCSVALPEGEPDVKKFVSTASVARDMLEIVERHGEWREKEAKRLMGLEKGCRGSSAAAKAVVPEILKYKSGEEKIQYWGFSYGTVLGNTFAAMFPDRIHRLVADGVVDIDDYKRTLWFDNLIDTEKDMDQFYDDCARVGFPQCALANITGKTTPGGVKNRYTRILQSLYHNPLPIVGPSAEVITYSDVKGLMFYALYHPLALFPLIAAIMAGIEQGDGEIFAQILQASHRFTCPSESPTPHTKGDNDLDSPMSYFAEMAISCTDGDDQRNISRPAFAEHVRKLTALSPSAGEIWSMIRLRCIHWNIRPQYRFEGPWKAKTSHPILQVGNTADPVTPGRFAKKMAEGFEGAVALLQDSPGHCSISAPSFCTQGFIRRYFQTGELPPEGTVCGVDEKPFGPAAGEGGVEGESVEVAELKRRQGRIASALFAAGRGLSPGILMRGGDGVGSGLQGLDFWAGKYHLQ